MAFTFKLEHPDGTPADPPTIRSAVPNWEIGDKIPFDPGKAALLVVGIRNTSEPTHTAPLSWQRRTRVDGRGPRARSVRS